VGVLGLMILTGLTEGVGLLMLVPLLELVNASGPAASGWVKNMHSALGWLGVPITTGALLAVFLGLVDVRSAVGA
jgi:ATP-binding cassette, subfamily C, bacterial